MNEYRDDIIEPITNVVEQSEAELSRVLTRRLLSFMAFINVGEYLIDIKN